MHIQDSHWSTASSASALAPGGTLSAAVGGGREVSRTTPLRVDAQRNLEHVLRAAREVFGELGYGAPMEDVARRARVGVGTVYRRFPSKDVLVRRIAEEETSRLTDQARTALGQEDEPWSALSRFLRTSVASGAGRLLPPQVLRVGVADEDTVADEARVPHQRTQPGGGELRLLTEPGTPVVAGTCGRGGRRRGSGGAAGGRGPAGGPGARGGRAETGRVGVGRPAGDRDGRALAAGRGAAGGGLDATAGHPAGGAALAAVGVGVRRGPGGGTYADADAASSVPAPPLRRGVRQWHAVPGGRGAAARPGGALRRIAGEEGNRCPVRDS